MDLIDILREILPTEIVDNFDLVRYAKTTCQFDIWCDEKKVQTDTDASNPQIVSEYKGTRLNEEFVSFLKGEG